jgi:hypothetical protein
MCKLHEPAFLPLHIHPGETSINTPGAMHKYNHSSVIGVDKNMEKCKLHQYKNEYNNS